MDLRKPKIFNDFGLNNSKGISSYLANQIDSVEEIIQFSGKENLDIISAGPVPPNPSELIESPRINLMLKKLKSNYDYLIFDTPPMGLVADSLQLSKHVNGIIYVSRFNYTENRQYWSCIK
jgi:Mrp family chromosome partitioning ATPase